MPICEYRHPLRTIRLHYNCQDSIIRITDYHELDVSETSTHTNADIILTSAADAVVHNYPVVTEDAKRREFELSEFLSELQPHRDRVIVIPTIANNGNPTWSTMIGIPHAPTNSVTEIEGLLAAASLEPPAVYIGSIGAYCWVADVHGGLHHLDHCSYTGTGTTAETMNALLEATLSTTQLHSQKLIVFGDEVTPQLLVELQRHFGDRFDSIERFQPFRLVRASVTPEVGQRILSRSHVVGYTVGAMALHQGIVKNHATEIASP